MKKHLLFYIALVAAFSIARAEEEAKPTRPIRILAPDGTPVVGAHGQQASFRDSLRINDGKTIGGFYGAKPLTSDDSGNIAAHEKTPYYNEPDWMMLLHETGYAIAEVLPETSELRLKPWRTMRSKLAIPHEARSEIVYYVHTLDEAFKRNDRIYWTGSAPIAEDGTFVLERLPEAAVAVALLIRPLADGERYKQTENVRCQYPTVFSVPSEKPLVVGEGSFNVTGKVRMNALPAFVRLVPKSHYYTHKVRTTDNEGRFTIPGVVPGDYDLVSYKGGTNLSDTTVLASCTVGNEDFDFGELQPYASEYPTTIQDNVTITADIVKRVEAKAKELCPQAIEKIAIGELAHPASWYGVRVTYAPQVASDDATRAVQNSGVIEVPHLRGYEIYSYEDKDKTNRGVSGYLQHFVDGDFKDARLRETEVRIFPLRTHTLALALDEGVDYETVLAMLRAIENGMVEKPKSEKNEDGSRRFTTSGSPPTAEDIPKIIRIKHKSDNTYEITTKTGATSGKNFTIQKDGETFIIVGNSFWVA